MGAQPYKYGGLGGGIGSFKSAKLSRKQLRCSRKHRLFRQWKGPRVWRSFKRLRLQTTIGFK